MGDHNNSIAILIFLMVIFTIASIFIPIGVKEGWFEPPKEEVTENETTEPDTDDNTDPTEVAIYYTDGDCCVSIYYKN